jgi:cell division topological specificity factor
MKHHSGTVAKERLRLMMDAEKNKMDEDTLWQIRTEIGMVITKYVNVEPENIEVRVLLKDYTKRD